MKSLVESLFDSDLVSKDTGYEYLYGLIRTAGVASDFRINYLDKTKIKHEFNKLSKKFQPKQWSSNPYTGMDEYQKIEMNELLRELLYIVVCSIPSLQIPFKHNVRIDDHKLESIIFKVLSDYVQQDFLKYVTVRVITYTFSPKECSIRIKFQLGKNRGRYPSTAEACVIRMEVNTSMLGYSE